MSESKSLFGDYHEMPLAFAITLKGIDTLRG